MRQTEDGYLKYLYFTGGAIVGASVEGSENFKDECIGDIAAIISSAYHIYYYMTDYMENETELSLAWSVTYMVKMFEIWYNIKCEALAEGIDDVK